MKQLDLTNLGELEGIIDHHSVEAVLDAIAGICFEKADHVKTNWQDWALASRWEKVGLSVLDGKSRAHVEGI